MVGELSSGPSWDHLFEVASGQDGLFTTRQAAEAGYSPQLLIHHMHAGRVRRVRRGVYRVVHFPASEQEDLVAIWLWSERQGVFSHHSALALHGLSDALPSRLHLIVPEAWRRRRLRVPKGVSLHFGDVARTETAWLGAVPLTTPIRTLRDCTALPASPDLIRQAVTQCLARGLATRSELAEVERDLDRSSRPSL